MSLKSIVTFSTFIWETGKQLLDVEISLGSADKSSSCKITIADPMHIIAAACINHSQSIGGIQALPDVNKQPIFTPPGAKSEGSPVTSVPPGNGTVALGTGFTPEVKAFLDTVAKRETSSPNTLIGYYQNNNVPGNVGQFNDTDITAGGGYPKSAGTGYNVGRYQFNRGDWSEAKGKNSAITGFTPLDQDLVAYSKIMNEGRGGKQLIAGDIVAALTQAGNEWASIPYISSTRPQNSIKQIQPGTTKQEYLDYYAQRLAFHKGGSGVAAAKAAPITKPAAPSVTDTANPVIKGSVIVIQIAGIYYEFMHQGTELSEAGITILIGQGVRWLMSRRKRSATYKDLNLQQLAEKVGKENKVKVDYQAVRNPTYSHLDQSGISDYQLLEREAKENGLLMTEVKGVIVIKERNQLTDSKLVLARGLNLISYKIADRAVGTHDDEISKLLPQTAKTTIDPITGKTQAIIKDVDRNATANKPTGISKPATAGTLKTGKASQVKEKAATKRIAGLPSTFVIPLTVANLTIEPIMTLHTQGFPGVLGNRLWVIKKITHKLADNTTTLDVVSPVEVLDANPVVSPPGAKPEVGGNLKSIGFVYPVSGTVTSLQGMRNGKPHNGIDIGGTATEGTPIYAAAGGTCVVNQFQAGGAGNYCTIKHENGMFTSYFHQRDKALPAVGVSVKQSEVIGYVGNTGGSRGAHLHFELLSSAFPPVRLQVSKYFSKYSAKLNSTIANTVAISTIA